jgi:hypothetical protein
VQNPKRAFPSVPYAIKFRAREGTGKNRSILWGAGGLREQSRDRKARERRLGENLAKVFEGVP